MIPLAFWMGQFLVISSSVLITRPHQLSLLGNPPFQCDKLSILKLPPWGGAAPWLGTTVLVGVGAVEEERGS